MISERHTYLRQSSEKGDALLQRTLNRVVHEGIQAARETFRNPPLFITCDPENCDSDVNPATASVAFGKLAIPKLKKKLLNSNKLKSKQAICSLMDIVCNPEKAAEALSLNIIPRFVRLIVSDDISIRKNALMTLQILAGYPQGLLSIVNNKYIITNLRMLLTDNVNNVRIEAIKIINDISRSYTAFKILIDNDFIPLVMRQLRQEHEEDILIYLLDTLKFLLGANNEARTKGLENNGFDVTVLLDYPQDEIRAAAADVLAQLYIHPSSKLQIIQNKTDVLCMLVDCLDDENVLVKAKAAGALMTATTTTSYSKNCCLNLQIIPRLLHHTQVTNCLELQLSALKALTNMAETLSGRQLLLPIVKFIKLTNTGGNVSVKKHIQILIETILWAP